ncbi:uracil-DNA glycosylase [Sandaracinobacter sp. RS1-74]|uniref:uracil-DNA glycosylase n=1 Tax=Sandaracinobacteroides sayramensis TaxID=2913411 RepID=UPI001EDC8EEA|nr:uracil-DNA glycosylase [Sandaracinobacteroides sayramensis]MCG2842221.1 uracil-DNA glycosylase [Sandaracinobacteroides sayramensis]
MQEAVEGARSASVAPAEIAALLDWWKLAGADVAVGDAPAPWLGAEPRPLPAPEMAPQMPPVRQEARQRPAPAEAGGWTSIQSLAALRERLSAEIPNIPFADGDPLSGLMLLGEAPSAEDLRTGRPFSGPAGLFLDRMLAGIGLDRKSCYIGLLCPRRRVPGPPPPDAIAADLELTRAHIRLAAPRLILLLGANPVQALAGTDAPIGRVRGQWLQVDAGAGPVPALASFNPAYLLRRPEEKAKAWADLLALRRRLLQ